MWLVWSSIVIAIAGIATGIYSFVWRPDEDPLTARALFFLGLFMLLFLWWRWSSRKTN
jgi:hypothetical protein